jgi:hypothetical protein
VATAWASAALADPPQTPQPPDQAAEDVGPGVLNIVELTDHDLRVTIGFLGYNFSGDLFSGPGGDAWGIGPHFNAFIGSASDAETTVSVARIFWITPGGSAADLADARFSGFAIGSCFCGNSAANIQFASNLTYDGVSNADPSNVFRDYACRADSAFTDCPILTNGASQIVPIRVETPDTIFQAPDLTVTFRDARFESPAPEPSAWALLIVGVGVAGAALRARRESANGPISPKVSEAYETVGKTRYPVTNS